MRLLIAGCGDLGIRLGRLWCEHGGSVVALRRRTDRLPACFETVAADLNEPFAEGLLQGQFDAIAYLVSADARNPQAYERAYVDGFKRLIEGVSSPVARVVFASSTAVYGEDAGGWVDESSITHPSAFNGQILLRAEQQVFKLVPHASIARFSGLYGPGRERMLTLGRAGEVGSARWGNRIHIDDAAGALMHMLRMEQSPSLVCVSDDEPARDDVVFAHLRQQLGLPALMPDPTPAATAHTTERGRRVSNRQLRASGFAFRYPSFVEGYAAVLADQRASAALL